MGGVLNPADVCVVLTTGARAAQLAAERIEAACGERQVPCLRVRNPPGAPDRLAGQLAERLRASRHPM